MKNAPLLYAENITYSRSGKNILLPVSIHLNAGEFLVITGTSGSGKSTLLKILSSLLTPSTGIIQLNGKDIKTYPPEMYRQQVSYCFQTPQLYGFTVADNLMLPWIIRRLEPTRQHLLASLAQLNLRPEMLDMPIDQLSGGEKQRVGLLRNLQFLPKVLLLDEVTSALDEVNKAAVHTVIDRLVAEQKLAVICISHDANEINDAARIVRLNSSLNEDDHEPTQY